MTETDILLCLKKMAREKQEYLLHFPVAALVGPAALHYRPNEDDPAIARIRLNSKFLEDAIHYAGMSAELGAPEIMMNIPDIEWSPETPFGSTRERLSISTSSDLGDIELQFQGLLDGDQPGMFYSGRFLLRYLMMKIVQCEAIDTREMLVIDPDEILQQQNYRAWQAFGRVLSSPSSGPFRGPDRFPS